MTALSSKVPATTAVLLGYFAAIAKASPTLNLQVVDSVEIEYVAENVLQFLGVSNHVQAPASLGNLRRDETFDLDCLVYSYSGDTDQSSTVRNTAYGILQQLVVDITGDYTAQHNLRFWDLRHGQEIAGPDGEGWSIQIPFTVSCQVTLEK